VDQSHLNTLGLPASSFPATTIRVYTNGDNNAGGMLSEKINGAYKDDLVEIPIETCPNYFLFYAL